MTLDTFEVLSNNNQTVNFLIDRNENQEAVLLVKPSEDVNVSGSVNVGNFPATLSESSTTTTVTTNFTYAFQIDCSTFNKLSLVVHNQGSNAFASALLQHKPTSDNFWYNFATTTADFTTNTGESLNNPHKIVRTSSTDLNVLPGTGRCYLFLDVSFLSEVRLSVRVDSGTSQVVTYHSLRV